MRIFIMGPYGDHNPLDVIAQNVAKADAIGRELLLRGHLVFIPHKMTWGWQLDKRLRREHWIALDNDFLLHWAEVGFRLPGDSPGAEREEELAHAHGMPVYYRIEDVPRSART